ncbi:pentatricopeptide repeat-containing protein At1g71060, mitochondrial-like [Phoenix dactylifera]|uniref:Pentatricopeptide repeat-containing protein At1g71060, mitochondrial-like n=1 Tax=Phoenix dactylifera TaxID=42345 RepID=A0A8B9A3F5_PHODC|nr:pentatricopeptide repeat-containing protein At1g71060, mitochondrial-like [Phoenix dactylifera]
MCRMVPIGFVPKRLISTLNPSSNLAACQHSLLIFSSESVVNPNLSSLSAPNSDPNYRHFLSKLPFLSPFDVKRPVGLFSTLYPVIYKASGTRILAVLSRSSFPHPRSIRFCFHLFSSYSRTSSKRPGVPNTFGRSGMTERKPRLHNVGVDPNKVLEIVEMIRGDASDLESKLNQINLRLSHALVAEILHVLNDRGISALCFFNWVLNSGQHFRPTAGIYNQIVNNLGRSDDFETMFQMLCGLSSKGHCLNEKAFSFLTRSSISLKDSISKIIETLNGVGGSCRGSGIYSVIKVLCAINAFHLAIFVMEETARKTSYYHVLIAAKCRNGDFQGAQDLLDEMRTFGCNPSTKSYNYLLGSLFKNKRVVEACELLKTMEELGYLPDTVTFDMVIIHACKANRMDFAVEFLNQILSEGIKPRMAMHAAFIKGYFWSGRVEDAYKEGGRSRQGSS